METKNIHVIPTDKSSRLHKTIDKGLFYLKTNYTSSSRWFNQNIYITSDEEIKEVDFYLDIDLKKVCKNINPNEVSFNTLRKIILTTDQDLIKDGVQAIDDEFLDWFIKNPSCEKVEVKTISWVDEETVKRFKKHETIIPKEEPKQETLEEVAENATNNELLSWENKYAKEKFIEGAKWQAERMYSEEDMKSAFKTGFSIGYGSDTYAIDEKNKTCEDWFKKFKKK